MGNDALHSFVVFEIIDDEDEKRCWTATNIVYDDQIYHSIDKNPKQLKMYNYPVVLPPSEDSRSEDDTTAELIVELYNPKKSAKVKVS